MSWFKRRPRIKEPQKHVAHHRRTPASTKMLEEAKQAGPNYKENKNENKNL